MLNLALAWNYYKHILRVVTHGYLDYDAFDLETREPEAAGIYDAVMQCNVVEKRCGKEKERERKVARIHSMGIWNS